MIFRKYRYSKLTMFKTGDLKTGNFNARTSSCRRKYSRTSEGTQIEVLTCSYGLKQLIRSPMQILQN